MSNSIELHPRLCPRDFWDNSCRNSDLCDKFHIRQPGFKLVIFNAAANLSRIDRKLKNSTLAEMRLPYDCSLFVVDSQVDPEDYGKQFTFRNRNIFVARAIGLHPSVRAPPAYLKVLHTHLKKLDLGYGLAYIGPFGGAQASASSDQGSLGPLTFIRDFNIASASPSKTRAVAIASNDDFLLRELTIGCPSSERPSRSRQDFFLWKTVGRSGSAQLEHIMESLDSNPHYFATFDSELSPVTRDALFNAFKSSTGRQCLLESVSPSVRTASNTELLPLAVVNTIVELYVDFRRKTSFKYSLAEFNNLFTTNGFSCIPQSRFDEVNQRALARTTTAVLSPAYYDHIYCSRGSPSTDHNRVTTKASTTSPLLSLMSLATTPRSAVSQRVTNTTTPSCPQDLMSLFGSFLATLPQSTPPVLATQSAPKRIRLDMGQILPTPAAYKPDVTEYFDTEDSPCSSMSPTLVILEGDDEDSRIDLGRDTLDQTAIAAPTEATQQADRAPPAMDAPTASQDLPTAAILPTNMATPLVTAVVPAPPVLVALQIPVSQRTTGGLEELVDLTTGKTTFTSRTAHSSMSVTQPTKKRARQNDSNKENSGTFDWAKLKRVKLQLERCDSLVTKAKPTEPAE